MGQIGLFDVENKLTELSKMGDPLEKLNNSVNWKIFKPTIDRVFRKERKSNAGRPPFDYVMMFKVLVLQHMYNLSDAQTQFQILDRHTFKRFLNAGDEVRIPDEKTIWLFRETLTQAGTIKKLFDIFNRELENAGFKAQKGQIIDASFVEVPRQRNSREENETIKNGDVPKAWENSPAKMRQKDTDAQWTKKNDQIHFGYKNHINVDVKNKIVREYAVSPANVHDSQVFEELLDSSNTKQSVWADSAYRSEECEANLKEMGYKSQICTKGVRNKPLSDFQIRMNSKKSQVRSRVEHVFGFMKNSMGVGWLRCIGLLRAAGRIGMTNLVYNMNRYVQLLQST